MNFAVSGHGRVAVAFNHLEAFLGADFHAIAAVDAAQAVNDPFLLRAIHQQRAGGAFLRADVAIDAIVLGENQLAARAGDGPCAVQMDSGWWAALSAPISWPVWTSRSNSYHLSVQLMQGSIVSTIIGTSARSHPGNTFNMAGRLANVGVRTRKRCRFFVPFAFKW